MIDMPRSEDEAAEVRRIVHNSENVFGILVSLDDKAAIIRANFIEGRLDYRRIFEEMNDRVIAPFTEGWIGADLVDVAPDRAEAMGVPKGTGIIIRRVFPGSAADKAGLFVFGATVVTRTASDAYLLSKKGYRAVSINGELFDSNSELVTLDFGSKIQDITRDILLSESIDKLRQMVVKLKNIIEIKIFEYNIIIDTKNKIEIENAQIEIQINEIENQIKDQKNTIENCRQENIQLNLEIERIKRRNRCHQRD